MCFLTLWLDESYSVMLQWFLVSFTTCADFTWEASVHSPLSLFPNQGKSVFPVSLKESRRYKMYNSVIGMKTCDGTQIEAKGTGHKVGKWKSVRCDKVCFSCERSGSYIMCFSLVSFGNINSCFHHHTLSASFIHILYTQICPIFRVDPILRLWCRASHLAALLHIIEKIYYLLRIIGEINLFLCTTATCHHHLGCHIV